MKKIFAISLLLIFVSFQSLSQETEVQKNIKELLVLTGSAELGIQVGKQLMANFSKAFPDVSQDFWDGFMKEIKPNDLINLIIPIYEKHYTAEEIKELIAFYKTPVGKKTIAVLPQITADSMKAGQAWGKEIAKKVMKQLEENK
jgi:hypothetical protein